MKRFIMVAMVVGVLALTLAGTAMAAPDAQGFGPGNGIHTPGTGLTTGTAAGTGANAGMGMRRGAPAWAGQPEEVATLLNLGANEIQAERLAGKSLAQIAADQGVSRDQLVSTILDARKADLDQLVKDSKLTQPQADAIYSQMQQQVTVMVDRTGTGPANAGVRMGAGGRWNR